MLKRIVSSPIGKKVSHYDKQVCKLKRDKDCLQHKLSYWRKQYDKAVLLSDEKVDQVVAGCEENFTERLSERAM